MTVYLGKNPVGIGRIVEKKVAKKKYGATVDSFLGDVDDNGVLQAPTEQTDLVFDGVKSISQRCFYYAFFSKKNIVKVDFGAITSIDAEGCNNAFNSCTGITGVNLSSLTTVGENGLNYAFNNCTGITGVNLSSLTTVGENGLNYAFNNCTGITSVLDLSSLTTVGSSGLNHAFYNCTGITGVNLSSLTTVGNNGLYYAFYNCKLLTIMSFPSLIKINGTSPLVAMFNNCSALVEIHFRTDAQSTIENASGYQYKFGATNATIYFDLIGTITVNGVAYARNEPNSIYVEYDKTYVAWADESGNIVYTTAGAEPAVGTVVYSDEGTTQVGTVSAVA